MLDSKNITQQVCAKIKRHTQIRRKTQGVCLVAACVLLCAGAAVGVSQMFSPVLPPVDAAAERMLQSAGVTLGETVECGDITFTVDGMARDEAMCYIMLTANAAPIALAEMSFVMQPWETQLAPDQTRTQNCAAVYFDETQQQGKMQLMLQYVYNAGEHAQPWMNLSMHNRTSSGHVALPQAEQAQTARQVAVDKALHLDAVAGAGSGANAGTVATDWNVRSVTVFPFGAIVEGEGVANLFATLQACSFEVQVQSQASAPPTALPAEQCTVQYSAHDDADNGTVRVVLRWNATALPETVTAITCNGEAILLP